MISENFSKIDTNGSEFKVREFEEDKKVYKKRQKNTYF